MMEGDNNLDNMLDIKPQRRLLLKLRRSTVENSSQQRPDHRGGGVVNGTATSSTTSARGRRKASNKGKSAVVPNNSSPRLSRRIGRDAATNPTAFKTRPHHERGGDLKTFVSYTHPTTGHYLAFRFRSQNKRGCPGLRSYICVDCQTHSRCSRTIHVTADCNYFVEDPFSINHRCMVAAVVDDQQDDVRDRQLVFNVTHNVPEAAAFEVQQAADDVHDDVMNQEEPTRAPSARIIRDVFESPDMDISTSNAKPQPFSCEDEMAPPRGNAPVAPAATQEVTVASQEAPEYADADLQVVNYEVVEEMQPRQEVEQQVPAANDEPDIIEVGTSPHHGHDSGRNSNASSGSSCSSRREMKPRIAPLISVSPVAPRARTPPQRRRAHENQRTVPNRRIKREPVDVDLCSDPASDSADDLFLKLAEKAIDSLDPAFQLDYQTDILRFIYGNLYRKYGKRAN